jgi:hypothetical protein
MRIKRINENWSQDFVTDFTDNGFDVDVNGYAINGQYKGKFVVTQVSRWFDDMLGKIDTEYNIMRTKTFFNSITGNANFEVVVAPPTSGSSIEFMLDGVKHEFYIKYVRCFGTYDKTRSEMGLSFLGNRGDGDSGTIYISVVESPVRKTKKIRFGYNNRTKNVFVSMDEVGKLLDLITSDKLEINYNYGERKYKYSELPNDSEKQKFDQHMGAIKSIFK